MTSPLTNNSLIDKFKTPHFYTTVTSIYSKVLLIDGMSIQCFIDKKGLATYKSRDHQSPLFIYFSKKT